MTIKVLVNGAQGKMGRIAIQAVSGQPDLVLVAQTTRYDDLAKTIATYQVDVVIDFTSPQAVFSNLETIIDQGARAIIGTTGLTTEQLEIAEKKCKEKQLGAIIAPNFSLGAILMMQYAQNAAGYLPHAEIIEMHHPQKLDAPSGTAIKTAKMMAQEKSTSLFKEVASPARGEIHDGIPIHSLRLPGFYSYQSVIFGAMGEVLTISHQGIDRQCCIPGILLACREVMSLNCLVYGLENFVKAHAQV